MPAVGPRVRHQPLQPAVLGAGGPALRRRVPGRADRSARQGLQHALGGLPGRRGAPHPHPRRGLPLPAGHQGPGKPGRLRLLYEANPIGFLIEQAGGRASTGRGRMLRVSPPDIHQRIGFVFGATDEVELIERYHRERLLSDDDARPAAVCQPRPVPGQLLTPAVYPF